MSVKTDRLIDLFPSVYAGREPESLLRKQLDAVGAELTVADDAVKQLLKSHWVDYASGPALDGLGASFGVTRRRLRSKALERDDAFRVRLQAVVPLFTGGGTTRAVKGAVQSALGLPFDFGTVNLPDALREDLERLVVVDEFSPTPERLVHDDVTDVGDRAEVVVDVDLRSAAATPVRLHWTFTAGSGRELSVELLGDSPAGVRSNLSLLVPAGTPLVLSTRPEGTFSAAIGSQDVSAAFTDLAGTGPPALPPMPLEPSQWRFRARGAAFGDSVFDDGPHTFDLPRFGVELTWTRLQPLTFDVTVPYFVQEVAEALAKRHNYSGEVFIFEGLPLEVIQDVVDETRAAGVRGSVQFSLLFAEDQAPREARFAAEGVHRASEDAAARDAMTIGSLNAVTENHIATESFALAAEFDIATFDGPFGHL